MTPIARSRFRRVKCQQGLAIDGQESPQKARALCTEHQLSCPGLPDDHASVARTYRVVGMPTTYVISPEGRFPARGIGGQDRTTAEAHQSIREPLTPVLHDLPAS